LHVKYPTRNLLRKNVENVSGYDKQRAIYMLLAKLHRHTEYLTCN